MRKMNWISHQCDKTPLDRGHEHVKRRNTYRTSSKDRHLTRVRDLSGPGRSSCRSSSTSNLSGAAMASPAHRLGVDFRSRTRIRAAAHLRGDPSRVRSCLTAGASKLGAEVTSDWVQKKRRSLCRKMHYIAQEACKHVSSAGTR